MLFIFRVEGLGGSRRCHTSLLEASQLPTGASAALGSQGASLGASKGLPLNVGKVRGRGLFL